MSFLSEFYPDECCASVYKMDFAALYAEGYRGIIFDIDNTLVPHDMPADRRSVKLFRRLRQEGFRTCLVSNNKEPRVKAFSEEVRATCYLYKAGKPGKRAYRNAMRKLGTTKEHTLVIGDQIFTDIWGAKRIGIRSILVEPVQKWREEPQIILKRFLEEIVLASYRRTSPRSHTS
ncbi:MAG: YqeG family HAD IIIA-type phosphatase [Lachnospiraceae bacterium]|nr:YqeG family HAD IIIA-type phosphatase [Lachnospiraceae bacterium]